MKSLMRSIFLVLVKIYHILNLHNKQVFFWQFFAVEMKIQLVVDIIIVSFQKRYNFKCIGFIEYNYIKK